MLFAASRGICIPHLLRSQPGHAHSHFHSSGVNPFPAFIACAPLRPARSALSCAPVVRRRVSLAPLLHFILTIVSAILNYPGRPSSSKLVEGSAEDNGNTVIDIMIANVSSVDKTQISYTLFPGIPAGTYHARLNGTIYNGNTVLSGTNTVSTLSNTFSIPDSGALCSVGTFTPVKSPSDPAYQPARITSPVGAQVIAQPSITGPDASLVIHVDAVDVLFDASLAPATMEVINTATGFNAGVQHTNLELDATILYATNNVTLDPGSWKVRMNFTIFSPASYPGTFSLESEEFFIVADSESTPNCTSSSSGATSSASGAGPTASGAGPTPSGGTSAPSGSTPNQSNQPSVPSVSGAALFPANMADSVIIVLDLRPSDLARIAPVRRTLPTNCCCSRRKLRSTYIDESIPGDTRGHIDDSDGQLQSRVVQHSFELRADTRNLSLRTNS
ncbi:hypothetical protein B0H11DRAFT_2252311 [Mycena galericulata]|nr:hypothetical protein B0H11DRAFT_2252311 [Mycena galericulata]